jgi:DNA-binding XRE family transcriptional regulator
VFPCAPPLMAANQRRKQLAMFLVERRRRINVWAAKIGDHARHPNRIGRPITQEEIAEAVAVSRVWYASLECGLAARPSPALLHRLATAFALSDEDRRRLFDLGIPELRSSWSHR